MPIESCEATTTADANGCARPLDDFVEVSPRVRLHVRDWGAGKPIVLLHDWPFCNDVFEYQFGQLAQRYRCVAPSLRGFGRSSQPWGACSLDVFADDLRSVLEARCLQDVMLLGFGLGGAIVLRYMARHAGYRVSKLGLLAAAAPVWTRRADFAGGGLDAAEVIALIRQCTSDRAQAMCRLITRLGRRATSSPLRDWLFNLAMQACPHTVVAAVRSLAEADLREDMASVDVATLVVHGVHDTIAPPSLGHALARGISGAQLLSFENSGHALLWEDWPRLNDEIEKFAN